MNRLILTMAATFTLLTFYGCKDSAKKESGTDKKVELSEKKGEQETKKEIDPALTESISKGQEVYTQNCAVCHQKSGGGVPNMNPPLDGTDYATGDKKRLITFVLNGSSDDHIEVKGATYSNVMPSFSSLSDEELSNVLTYVRNSFGNQATGISADEVKEVRGKVE